MAIDTSKGYVGKIMIHVVYQFSSSWEASHRTTNQPPFHYYLLLPPATPRHHPPRKTPTHPRPTNQTHTYLQPINNNLKVQIKEFTQV